jgi:hypothetical protein
VRRDAAQVGLGRQELLARHLAARVPKAELLHCGVATLDLNGAAHEAAAPLSDYDPEEGRGQEEEERERQQPEDPVPALVMGLLREEEASAIRSELHAPNSTRATWEQAVESI